MPSSGQTPIKHTWSIWLCWALQHKRTNITLYSHQDSGIKSKYIFLINLLCEQLQWLTVSHVSQNLPAILPYRSRWTPKSISSCLHSCISSLAAVWSFSPRQALMWIIVLGLSQNSLRIPRITLHKFFCFNLVKRKGKKSFNLS